MESLSPECTPLKHRYDSCFNAWFEGYLQPALAASNPTSSSSTSTPSSSSSSSSSLTSSIPSSTSTSNSTPSPAQPSTPNPAQTPTPTAARKEPLITSWSKAFPSKRLFGTRKHSVKVDPSTPKSEGEEQEHHWYDFALLEEDDDGEVQPVEQIDTKGKSRSQIKAEEYERNCGRFWLDYQGCLKNAINQNESLSTLLETAREEHPLGSLDGLKGTPWDSNKDFTKEQE